VISRNSTFTYKGKATKVQDVCRALGVRYVLEGSVRKANALNSSLPLVYEALGNAHLFKRQYEKAIAAARRWVEIEPNNADAYANLAGALHFSGESEQAVPLIEKAMRLNPFYPFYYILYRGQSFLAMERYEEALEALKRSAVHNPEAMPTHLYLAACYALMDKDAPAREALAEAHRIYPDFSVTWVYTYFPYKRATDLDRLLNGPA
jgi:adenylate cyclase